ncbi:MAG TPA: GFA family protein [Inquilinus sp.]|nr:GFA family protein [Inquilinus sp.]
MLYKGSCHCGQVAFEVEGELTGAISCNCSICSRKGALLWAVPHDTLRLRASPDGLGTYLFNRHAIQHRFCRTCGIHPFAEDADPAGERSAYINLRCIEGLDLATVPVQEFDGRSM